MKLSAWATFLAQTSVRGVQLYHRGGSVVGVWYADAEDAVDTRRRWVAAILDSVDEDADLVWWRGHVYARTRGEALRRVAEEI